MIILISLFSACRSIPRHAEAVQNFDIDRYAGKWYEIARMDFRFERNLKNTSAYYGRTTDGKISVLNRGQDITSLIWKEAHGKAKFVNSPSTGMLKVSFFGPFYAGYNVLAIEGDYQYALVSGSSMDYLWLLSREKTMPEPVKNRFLEKATSLGARVEDLVWVIHDQTE